MTENERIRFVGGMWRVRQDDVGGTLRVLSERGSLLLFLPVFRLAIHKRWMGIWSGQLTYTPSLDEWVGR